MYTSVMLTHTKQSATQGLKPSPLQLPTIISDIRRIQSREVVVAVVQHEFMV